MASHADNNQDNASDRSTGKSSDGVQPPGNAVSGLDLVSLSAGDRGHVSGLARGIQHTEALLGHVQLADAQGDSQDKARQIESAAKLRDIQVLAGDGAKNPVAQDSEALLLHAGASFAATPNNLGSEGCMAAISTNVLKPLSEKYNLNIPYFQDSHAFVKFMQGHPQIADVYKVKINDLTSDDIKPGDIVVGTKSDGNHAMGWARVPQNWHWDSRDMLAVGNTGLPEFGKPAMRLAQEYIGPKDQSQYESEHNYHHGMISSHSPSNPYRVGGGAQFVIVRFKNPDGTPSSDGPPPHGHK